MKDYSKYKEEIISLLKENKMMYFGDMVKKLGTSPMHIEKYLVELLKEDIIEKDSSGGKFKLK